jgi:diaminopimelate epimerase
VKFAKYEGAGNDFVVVHVASPEDISRERAVALCDRHYGIGADGVLLVLGDGKRMIVRNADGTRPEMCGNGLRCVAWDLARTRGFVEGAEYIVETDAGPRSFRFAKTDDAALGLVSIGMGKVQYLGDERLKLALGEAQALELEVAIGDAGNPHAIFFGPPRSTAEMQALGEALGKSARFPNGVNVGFAQRASEDSLRLVVFERGVGFTLACGTGACAAAVAAWAKGLTRAHGPTDVVLPGGTLTITAAEEGHVEMRGPARLVFVGELNG